MRWLWVGWFLGMCGWAGAMGNLEDPAEKLTKTWQLDRVNTLEIRGEVEFQIVPGVAPKVTVETSRALFDQLTVSNWWGATVVAIETGLRGPRELGEVNVIIELPSLGELTVLGQSSGRVQWPPGPVALVRVGEASSLTLQSQDAMLTIEASWKSTVQLSGSSSYVTASLRHESRLDLREFSVKTGFFELDEHSTLHTGDLGKVGGKVRHGSRVTASDPSIWAEVQFREESVLESRTD